jgi:hypothetical protein
VGQWGGLNDATRNQEFSIGTFRLYFRRILGTQEINTRFSLWVPESRSQYKYELQLAHYGNLCLGMGSSGWAVVSAWEKVGAGRLF